MGNIGGKPLFLSGCCQSPCFFKFILNLCNTYPAQVHIINHPHSFSLFRVYNECVFIYTIITKDIPVPVKDAKRFNMHFHERKDRDPGVDYQCYTSVNRGSQTERQKRGLSMEGTCDTPFIPGWKMEMMASHIFKRYINNAEDTLQLAYSLLEQHIDDQEEIPDNSDAIHRNQSEIDKLNRKLANLIEMREDGDIDKEYFRERKKEIEAKISRLAQSIKSLEPVPTKDVASEYSGRLSELKKKLEEYTNFEGLLIPESVVEAFVQKIWVSKDEFRWYLRTNKHSSEDDADHIQIGAFTLTLDDAKKYQYSFSTRKRIYNWEDLNVTVWI